MRKLFMFRFPEGENETVETVAEVTQADIAAETEVENTEDAPEVEQLTQDIAPEDDAPADDEVEG